MQLLCTTRWGSGGGDRDDGREVEGPRAFSIRRAHTHKQILISRKSREAQLSAKLKLYVTSREISPFSCRGATNQPQQNRLATQSLFRSSHSLELSNPNPFFTVSLSACLFYLSVSGFPVLVYFSGTCENTYISTVSLVVNAPS
jgi:hypothetical protein